MDRKTKIKVTAITVISVVAGLLYVNRGQLIAVFKRQQAYKEWDKNEPKGQLINGKKNGKWTTTYKNGQLESEESYLNDTLYGCQLVYYTSGQLYIKRNYFKGKEVDSILWYHSNGQINIEEFSDSSGLKQGPFKIYYSTGQPSQIAYHKDGELDGESRSFFDNGQLWDIKYYKLGQRVGTWIEFSKTGDTVKVEKY